MSSHRLPHFAARPRADEPSGIQPIEPVLNAAEYTYITVRRLLDEGRAEEAMGIIETEIEGGDDSLELQFLLGRAASSMGDHVHRTSRATGPSFPKMWARDRGVI